MGQVHDFLQRDEGGVESRWASVEGLSFAQWRIANGESRMAEEGPEGVKRKI